MAAQATGAWGNGPAFLFAQRYSCRAKNQVGQWCAEQVGPPETTTPR